DLPSRDPIACRLRLLTGTPGDRRGAGKTGFGFAGTTNPRPLSRPASTLGRHHHRGPKSAADHRDRDPVPPARLARTAAGKGARHRSLHRPADRIRRSGRIPREASAHRNRAPGALRAPTHRRISLFLSGSHGRAVSSLAEADTTGTTLSLPGPLVSSLASPAPLVLV
ncbi:MAG: hypothetical protein, partial [Olavius algarvensis Gamma 1 endosymbiont]